MNTYAKKGGDAGMPAVRKATDRDIPEIVSIVNAAFQVESDFRAGERTSTEEISALMQSGTFLVAMEQERVVVAVQVRTTGTIGYFGMLAVDPRQQRSGVGRALLEAAENHCRKRGCTEMTLSTGSVRRELFPYYEKFGYTITAVEPAPEGAPFTKPIEIVKMVKPL
jgi:ribosomal protein S18 acetylase RimI-like enzyme